MADMDFDYGVSSYNDNSQTIVLVFYKGEGEGWENTTANFDRVPNVGEYFALSRDSDWFEVKAVVHMGFPLDYDAEIYAVKVENRIALRQSFANV